MIPGTINNTRPTPIKKVEINDKIKNSNYEFPSNSIVNQNVSTSVLKKIIGIKDRNYCNQGRNEKIINQ